MKKHEELPESEVHVWYVFENRLPKNLSERLKALPQDEIERNAKFSFDEGKREHLVTRALVRTVLSKYADVRSEDWRFEEGAHGKPSISHPRLPKELSFNLSHSHGLIACAIAWEKEIGVDVENLTRKAGTDEIAESHFAPSEVDDFKRQPSSEAKARRFFEYWTLKEAYIKARGMGLQIPLDKFAFSLSDGENISISIDPSLNDDAKAWKFCLHRPHENYLLALGIKGGWSKLVIRELPAKEIE